MDIAQDVLMPLMVSFLTALILGKYIIKILKNKHIGQEIRDDGPKSHLSKAGTPTMGGLIFIIATIITMFIFKQFTMQSATVVIGMLAFGAIGFIDDFKKLVMKRSLGLNEKQKIILQFLVAIIIIFLCKKSMVTEIQLQYIPFVGKVADFGYYIYPLLVLCIVGTVNATNLTDGLDGLCTGVTIPIFMILTIISFLSDSRLSGISSIFTGSLMAFLIYNSNKASVFMGDTGSMAIGGALVSICIMHNMIIYLIILGGIYVIEALSVILQVLSYKLRDKKRIFLMSPIHHHFELKGYSEPKIVFTFSMISWMLSILVLYDIIQL